MMKYGYIVVKGIILETASSQLFEQWHFHLYTINCHMFIINTVLNYIVFRIDVKGTLPVNNVQLGSKSGVNVSKRLQKFAVNQSGLYFGESTKSRHFKDYHSIAQYSSLFMYYFMQK